MSAVADRVEALKEAEAAADRIIGEAPTNSRGYPVDGWRPTSPTDRAAMVLKIAAFLLGEEPDA